MKAKRNFARRLKAQETRFSGFSVNLDADFNRRRGMAEWLRLILMSDILVWQPIEG
jgi:hypothetical protein